MSLVEAAKREIEEIPADEAVKLADRDDVVLVDIRDIREVTRDGKVPGAFHAPRGMLEFWIDPASPYFSPCSATTRSTCFSAPAACAPRLPPRRRRTWG
jgi:rhodanese-related sulfurtransferase